MVQKKYTKKTSVKAKKAESRKTENKFKGKDDAPVTVKIISILNYVNAALWFVIGLLMIISSSAMIEYALSASPELASYDSGLLTMIMVFIGIFLIGFGVFHFFIGRGLWRLKQWARIASVILGIIGVITAVISMTISFGFGLILNLLIDGFIAGYLLFTQEAKEAFRK